jgi:NAD+ synthase (glutamine-hydrolysing)
LSRGVRITFTRHQRTNANIRTVLPARVEDFYLPDMVSKVQDCGKVLIGDAVVSTTGLSIGASSYHELLAPKPPQTAMSGDGILIHTVSAANHHELGEFDTRFHLLQKAATETGGVFLYANSRGYGGDRTYSDGGAMIFVNGELVAQGRQFSLEDVEVITATINLDDIEPHRTNQHEQVNFFGLNTYQRVSIDFDLSSKPLVALSNGYNSPIASQMHRNEEEMALSACWMWDYLRRSKAAGFLVPLSGGIDSCSTAIIAFSLCRIVVDALQKGNAQVEADVRCVVWEKEWLPKTPEELCNRILHTVYMGVNGHSSETTRSRARRLAQHIGAYHTDMNIDSVYQTEKDLARQYLGHAPDFGSGSMVENLALQNIQARLRMVTAYYFAQMLPSTRGRPGGGTLLVLGSINVEECLRGSLTKHDCSSADLSPIGSYSKVQIRDFINWASTCYSLPVLDEFLHATPSAELEPAGFGQCDDKDMGMTLEEISTFAKLRQEMRLGPLSMFQRLLNDWRGRKNPGAIAVVVKKFHKFYGINRHKMTTMTPAYHAGKLNPDHHRHDMRPMLYPAFEDNWSCKRIDQMAEQQKAQVD